MKRLALIIIGLLSAVHLWSQAAPISGQVLNQYGQAVAGAQVYICNAATSTGLPCTPPANIFYDYNLTNAAPNPFPTDANGNFNVYVGAVAFPNVYVVNAVPQAGTTYTELYSGPSCPLSGCTFTGPITATLFNATTFPYYEINGVQITSNALSDHANIAYINVANVFTASPQTAPVFNALTQYNVNGSQIAASNLANGTTGTGLIVLQTSPTLITPVLGVATGTSLNVTGVLAAGTTVTGGTGVNASTNGYQLGGAAPLNHILLGNGTYYVDSATLPPSLVPTLYYQTVESNGTAETQRPALNFSTDFAVSDSASPARTNVAFNPSGVTAGSYTCSNITVTSTGILTAATSTANCNPTFTGTSGYQILPSGVIIEWGSTGSIANDTPTGVTFPFAFPNAALSVTCSDVFAGSRSAIWSCYNWTTTGFTGRPDTNTATAQYVAIGY